jgi:hypothetical protein
MKIMGNLHVKVRGMRWLMFRIRIGAIVLRLAGIILGPRVTISVDIDTRVKVRAIDHQHFEARI